MAREKLEKTSKNASQLLNFLLRHEKNARKWNKKDNLDKVG